jgi:hypothetical protein
MPDVCFGSEADLEQWFTLLPKALPGRKHLDCRHREWITGAFA